MNIDCTFYWDKGERVRCPVKGHAYLNKAAFSCRVFKCVTTFTWTPDVKELMNWRELFNGLVIWNCFDFFTITDVRFYVDFTFQSNAAFFSNWFQEVLNSTLPTRLPIYPSVRPPVTPFVLLTTFYCFFAWSWGSINTKNWPNPFSQKTLLYPNEVMGHFWTQHLIFF